MTAGPARTRLILTKVVSPGRKTICSHFAAKKHPRTVFFFGGIEHSGSLTKKMKIFQNISEKTKIPSCREKHPRAVFSSAAMSTTAV